MLIITDVGCGVLITCMLFPGMDGESFSPGDESFHDPASHEDEGNNLIHSRPSVAIRESVLLDLPRDEVDRGLFESFTYTGALFRKPTETGFLSLHPFEFLDTFLSSSIPQAFPPLG